MRTRSSVAVRSKDIDVLISPSNQPNSYEPPAVSLRSVRMNQASDPRYAHLPGCGCIADALHVKP